MTKESYQLLEASLNKIIGILLSYSKIGQFFADVKDHVVLKAFINKYKEHLIHIHFG